MIIPPEPSKETFAGPLDARHPDYLERVYSGVLGKLIGVYLGRPVENWTYEAISEKFGKIDYYVHEQRGRRLIITDDDISGTFTFLRALEDYDFDPNLTSAQVGQTWLNYLIEKTTILWWGGMGNSTEHTAYLRLKQGIKAPASGSMEMNSKVVSEQIGGQIFIDGWGMVCPGRPDRAADFAGRAARVSHDGEAVYGAQVVASLVSLAFIESDIDRLLDGAVAQIPAHCTVRRLIDDLRSWHRKEDDWRENRLRLEKEYGYDKYFGQCHLIPNHGLIILSLLHGAGNFDKSMEIVNTAGWDTDCNSGNVGAILGVRNGLAGFEGKDWRGPVADRLYLPSADGGRAITDAAREALAVANAGRQLLGEPPLTIKDGERFNFWFPGSVQGWQAEAGSDLTVKNAGRKLRLTASGKGGRAATPTFITPEIKDLVSGYVLIANPTLYPGHKVIAQISATESGAAGRLYLAKYDAADETVYVEGPAFELAGGEEVQMSWLIPNNDGYPYHQVGIELDRGVLDVHTVGWKGVPSTSMPVVEGTMWARAWAKSVDRFEYVRDKYEYLTHNEGVGLLTQGHRDWSDYRIRARVTPKMASAAGLAVRVQGLRRYYAVVFAGPGEVKIVKALDGNSTLAQTSFPWEPFKNFDVEVEVRGNEIRAFIDGKMILTAVDSERPLTGGAFGVIVDSGCVGIGTPSIEPL